MDLICYWFFFALVHSSFLSYLAGLRSPCLYYLCHSIDTISSHADCMTIPSLDKYLLPRRRAPALYKPRHLAELHAHLLNGPAVGPFSGLACGRKMSAQDGRHCRTLDPVIVCVRRVAADFITVVDILS